MGDEARGKYAQASVAITDDFYMDDFLSGAETVEKAVQLRSEVQTILAEGGFQLRKWSSNRREALAELPSENIEEMGTLHFETEPRIKTLGVAWETEPDKLCIEVRATVNEAVWTKRKVFSAIAQLYDPLGLVSPWAKIKMQHLWLASVEWDDIVPEQIGEKWEEFYGQLPMLQHFKVPRFVLLDNPQKIHFHVFSDASEIGYGACMYARSISKDGQIKVELIASKSRVAPLKRLSLPRLELCAALLGAKLYARVAAALRMEGIPCWFWSDSTVTLHWIQAPPNTWQTFVGNRTAEIQLLTHGHIWNHVKGVDNPADYISRGMLPKEFLTNTVWRRGPTWLSEDEENWPKHLPFDPLPDEILERRKTVAIVQQGPDADSLISRFSSFWRLVRVTAYMLRFINSCRQKTPHNHTSFLTVSELKEAKESLVKSVQQKEFTEELKELKRKRNVSPKSSLKLLKPFVDVKGILRVGGRLEQSEEKYQTKHPMILPNNHMLSRLIAAHFHTLSCHSGPRMTLSSMRQEFWPISGRKVANFVRRNYPKCFRHHPVPIAQSVGQLPKARITPSRPFSITGVDYCGPVFMKPAHRRAAPQKAPP